MCPGGTSGCRVNLPPNFAYLAHHDGRLVALAPQAEEHFASDPPTSLAKLRLFAEVLAKRAAAKVGSSSVPNETQQALVDPLFEKNVIGATQRNATHPRPPAHGQRRGARGPRHGKRGAPPAQDGARADVWFQRSFGNNGKFDPRHVLGSGRRDAIAAERWARAAAEFRFSQNSRTA